MRFTLPNKKLLIVTWLLLMALTLASMYWGKASSGSQEVLGLSWVGLVLAVTVIKARQILYVYLNLRQSTGGWRAFFMAFLLAVCFGIGLTYLIPPFNGS